MVQFCATPFLEGCGTGAGLIMAIGAQNAFVLKQGIIKNHVLVTVLLCAFIDVLLISVGVGGCGALLATNEWLLTIARWGGAAFLLYYGFRSFRAVFQSESLTVDTKPKRLNLKETVLITLALSLLNPHAYLDAMVLLGSIGAQFPLPERLFFALGAMLASFVWFFALGYGARHLAPLFQKPLSWKVLDFFVGCVMWIIGFSLLFWTPDSACDFKN
jgi:L-lysine exporter family protein LysE/ArgO